MSCDTDVCKKCADNFVVNGKSLVCKVCCFKYHLNCVSVKDSWQKVLTENENIFWYCDLCLVDLKTAINCLTTKEANNYTMLNCQAEYPSRELSLVQKRLPEMKYTLILQKKVPVRKDAHNVIPVNTNKIKSKLLYSSAAGSRSKDHQDKKQGKSRKTINNSKSTLDNDSQSSYSNIAASDVSKAVATVLKLSDITEHSSDVNINKNSDGKWVPVYSRKHTSKESRGPRLNITRRLTNTEISQILYEDSNEIEADMVFDESGAESDHVSNQHDSDDTEEEEQGHNEPSSDDEMSQPLSNFAHRSIYIGKYNTICSVILRVFAFVLEQKTFLLVHLE
ncbi:hypothetical protein HHI36_009779 [Cryptolaemus montrouzieri]|uniref:Zinc finger PHD-type domain-containing protein n=1 Tax=Cryptolaemus montrouzieri TaxID=559131 RepID=A0ABD2MGY1_9CUCU